LNNSQSDPDYTRYSVAVDRFSMERDRTERLNGRAGEAVGISGTLMALFLGLGNSVVSGVQKTNALLPYLQASLVVGLILFSIDLFVFLLAFRVQKYRMDPNPSGLIGELADLSHRELIRQLTTNLVGATIYNHNLNNSKAKVIRRGFYLLGFSILVVLSFGVTLVVALAIQ